MNAHSIWIPPLVISAAPFQGPLWGHHRGFWQNQSPRLHSHCYIWQNQPKEASLPPHSPTSPEGLWVSPQPPAAPTLRLPVGIQLRCDWSLSEPPSAPPSQALRSGFCLWKVHLELRIYNPGHGGRVALVPGAISLHKSTFSPCFTPPRPHPTPRPLQNTVTLPIDTVRAGGAAPMGHLAQAPRCGKKKLRPGREEVAPRPC